MKGAVGQTVAFLGGVAICAVGFLFTVSGKLGSLESSATDMKANVSKIEDRIEALGKLPQDVVVFGADVKRMDGQLSRLEPIVDKLDRNGDRIDGQVKSLAGVTAEIADLKGKVSELSGKFDAHDQLLKTLLEQQNKQFENLLSLIGDLARKDRRVAPPPRRRPEPGPESQKPE
jgi:archaellum component FlaC